MNARSGFSEGTACQRKRDGGFSTFYKPDADATSRQILFLQTLRTFLETRRVEKRDLVDEPVTRVHPSGIQDLFGDAEIEEILGLARELVRSA
jgi:hypothetical protein